MQGLKFRETHIIKIIEESLSKLSRDDRVVVAVDARLDDAAVWMDREQIVSALVDLERNALEAMPDGGKLTIAVEGDDRIITLRLADTGRGIPEENIPLLFTPFLPPNRSVKAPVWDCLHPMRPLKPITAIFQLHPMPTRRRVRRERPSG